MKVTRNLLLSKQIIVYEIIGFSFIILFIWFNELLDIPHYLFGTDKTPVNWSESLIESVVVAILGLITVYHTKKMFYRIKLLEGILPICTLCKKIRDEKGHWHQIESYIHHRSEAKFSHSLCPDCAKRFYPEFYLVT